MDDLVTWLREQLDEDELWALAAIEEERFFPSPEFTIAYQWERRTRHTNGVFGSGFVPGAPSPTRVLAEVDAKRRILAEVPCTDLGQDGYCRTAKLLALPYADRPGYREEWRP